MSKETHSSESKENPLSNPTIMVAVIGGIVTLLGALITISPELLALTRKATETPTPTLTFTAFPTIPATETPTELIFTETATQIPPTPTETITPSPTPVDPGISCLDRWEVISTNPDLLNANSQGNCSKANVSALGISSSRAGISFGVNSFREQGTFGITTSLPPDAHITLQLDLNVLSQGEFWIALSDTPKPENHMMIMAFQPGSGEIRFYNNQTSSFSTKYEWSQLLTNTNLTASSPRSYQISFTISGNRVSPRIYFTNLTPQIVNLPNYLFLGYSKKSSLGSMTLQADIPTLTIEGE